MKIVVNKSDLEESLSAAAAGLLGNHDELNGHYIFRRSGDNVEVLTSNGRVGAASTFECISLENNEGGEDSFTLDGTRFKKWLSACRVSEITIINRKGIVKVKGKNTNTFESKDPNQFPYWDDALEGATKSCTVNSKKFRDILMHAKNFALEKETEEADRKYTVCDVGEGLVRSTDGVALSISKVDCLIGATFTIYGKVIPTVCSFLHSASEEVDIYEFPKGLFLKSRGRDILMVGRPMETLMKSNYSLSEEDIWEWDVNVSDLKSGIQQLTAVSSSDTVALKFRCSKDGEGIKMSMKSTSGEEDVIDLVATNYKHRGNLLEIALQSMFSKEFKNKARDLKEDLKKDGGDEKEVKAKFDAKVNELFDTYYKSNIEDKANLLVEKGFSLNYKTILKVISGWSKDTIRFYVCIRPGYGLVRFIDHRGDGDTPDTYLLMVVWIRDLS